MGTSANNNNNNTNDIVTEEGHHYQFRSTSSYHKGSRKQEYVHGQIRSLSSRGSFSMNPEQFMEMTLKNERNRHHHHNNNKQ